MNVDKSVARAKSDLAAARKQIIGCFPTQMQKQIDLQLRVIELSGGILALADSVKEREKS